MHQQQRKMTTTIPTMSPTHQGLSLSSPIEGSTAVDSFLPLSPLKDADGADDGELGGGIDGGLDGGWLA